MTTSRALITGINGFCGRHLAKHLIQHGYKVAGIDLLDSPIPDIPIFKGDIRDTPFVKQIMRTIQPTHIFHLAAIVDHYAKLSALYNINVIGTESILESIEESTLDPIILITGSSAVYGKVGPEELPIKESHPINPLNAYAVGKISEEMLALSYYSRYGQKIIRTRTFNLVGPGEPHKLVCSAFAEQIAQIMAGRHEPVIHVGNLTTQRDLTDVRDIVRAYRLLVERGKPGQVYNVCSGKAIKIQTCLDKLCEIGQIPIEIEQDLDRMRQSDIPVSLGDNQLLFEHTGWRPTVSLEQSLADLLDDWRQRIEEA